MSPDGQYLTAPWGPFHFGIWSLATGERIATFGDPAAFSVLAFWSPAGDMVATASADQRFAVVWDVSDVRHPVRLRELALGAVPSGFPNTIVHPYWSHDGHRVAALDYQRNRATVFDVASGREIWSRTVGGTLGQVAFSPDDRTFAVVTRNEVGFSDVTLWDTNTWRQRRSFVLPGAGGHGVEFVRGGELLLTTSEVAGGPGFEPRRRVRGCAALGRGNARADRRAAAAGRERIRLRRPRRSGRAGRHRRRQRNPAGVGPRQAPLAGPGVQDRGPQPDPRRMGALPLRPQLPRNLQVVDLSV